MIDYESPVFVSIVLYTIYALLLLAVGLTVWSVVRSLRMRGKEHASRKVIWSTLALLLVTLGATWLMAGTKPLNVNGRLYDNSTWLRISDILIMTPIILIVVIAVLMIVAEVIRRRSHV